MVNRLTTERSCHPPPPAYLRRLAGDRRIFLIHSTTPCFLLREDLIHISLLLRRHAPAQLHDRTACLLRSAHAHIPPLTLANFLSVGACMSGEIAASVEKKGSQQREHLNGVGETLRDPRKRNVHTRRGVGHKRHIRSGKNKKNRNNDGPHKRMAWPIFSVVSSQISSRSFRGGPNSSEFGPGTQVYSFPR